VHSLSTDNFTIKDVNDLSLYIANIPSLNDIKRTIDDYYTKNGLYKQKIPSPLVSNLNIISVRIDFPNEKILNGYKSYISFLKYENPQFKQIVIKKTNLFRTIKKIKLNNVKTINNSNSDVDNLLLNEKNEKKIIVRNILKLYRHNKIKLKLDNDKFTYNTLGLRKSDDEKLIVNFYKNQEYLRNSSPYLSEEDKRIIKKNENSKNKLCLNLFEANLQRHPSVKGLFDEDGNMKVPTDSKDEFFILNIDNKSDEKENNDTSNINPDEENKENKDNKDRKLSIPVKINRVEEKLVNNKETFFIEMNDENRNEILKKMEITIKNRVNHYHMHLTIHKKNLIKTLQMQCQREKSIVK